MKQIENLLPTAEDLQQRSQDLVNHCKPESPLNLEDRVIDRVFVRLTMLYGHKFASLIPDEVHEEELRRTWSNHLAGLTVEQIKQGIDTVMNHFVEWPPTVGQFKQLCKVGDDPANLAQLPKPRGDEQLALSALAECQRILKSNQPEPGTE